MFSLLLVALFSVSEACMSVQPSTPGIKACRACSDDLIEQSVTGASAKKMDSDVRDPTGDCTVRTFTCKGWQASIEAWNGAESLGVIAGVDNGIDKTATMSVTCKGGTRWERDGIVITRVECSTVAPINECKSCKKEWITVTEALPYGKTMDGDVSSTVGECAARTFTCNSLDVRGQATFQLFTGNGVDAGKSSDDNNRRTATFVVVCNRDGTGWESPRAPGIIVTGIACTSPLVVR